MGNMAPRPEQNNQGNQTDYEELLQMVQIGTRTVSHTTQQYNYETEYRRLANERIRQDNDDANVRLDLALITSRFTDLSIELAIQVQEAADEAFNFYLDSTDQTLALHERTEEHVQRIFDNFVNLEM